MVELRTKKDMDSFLSKLKGKEPFIIQISRDIYIDEKHCKDKLREMIRRRKLSPGSEMLQGIRDIEYNGAIKIEETPVFYPSNGVIECCPEFTGAMTGVLVNAYDPKNKTFLFHMRGKSVDEPFGFQAAAAGFGVYKMHPHSVAKKELKEEARIDDNIYSISGSNALGIFQFMKGEFPQPLFNFGFLYDSEKHTASSYPILYSLEEIAEFEERIKTGIKNKKIALREGYHFHIPQERAERIVEEIYERDPLQKGKNGGFFGPIAESHENFVRFLTDLKYI